MRILIIDDEKTIRKGTMLLLEQTDYDAHIVGEAGDGEEGMAKVKLLKPDVAIVDIRMPILDGLEMVRLLHEQGQAGETNFVVVTAHSEFEYARKAVRYGVRDFLLKPLDVHALNELFARLTRQAGEAADPSVGIGRQWVERYIGGRQIGHEAVLVLLHYLADNYMKDIQLADAAAHARISTVYASQLFRKVTGETFVSFLQELRIEAAKTIMTLHPSYKINEVAYMTGFNDLTYFGRVFKTKTGMTPVEFMRKG